MLKRFGAVFASGALVGVIAVLASRAGAGGRAAAVPLRYAGKLEAASGEAVTGERNLQINFWKEELPNDSEPLCFTLSKKLKLDAGRFSIELPDKCTQAVRENADVWSEVLVNGESMGRTKLAAVPYALGAEHALRADAASGPLLTTIEALSRKTRVVTAPDGREGCPPAAEPGTPLVTVNFTLSKETAVHISGTLIRHAAGRADLELVVDNVSRLSAITNTGEVNDWISGYVQWTGMLSEGEHTAWVQGRVGVPTTPNIWGCGAGHGSMSALIFE